MSMTDINSDQLSGCFYRNNGQEKGRMMRKRLVFLFLIMVCSLTIKAWAQSKSYTFGIPPIYNPQVIEEGFKPVMRYL